MGKNYEVWLSYNNREEVLQLPCLRFSASRQRRESRR